MRVARPPIESPVDAGADPDDRALRAKVSTIVVIYAENRAFDNLYGNFPGAAGLGEVIDRDGRPLPAYVAQRDRDGTVLAVLPPTWGGVTAPGLHPGGHAGAERRPAERAVLDRARVHGAIGRHALRLGRDARSVAPILRASDADRRRQERSICRLVRRGRPHHGALRHQRVRALCARAPIRAGGSFFQGAFGGSFLNHQYLICACAPEYPECGHGAGEALDRDTRARCRRAIICRGSSPPRTRRRSALDGPPSFARSGNIAPANYFGDGKFYAVNTMQPPYQPSGNAPAAGDASGLYADPGDCHHLAAADRRPPSAIGLSAKNIRWVWYAGAWDAAIADGSGRRTQLRQVIYAPDTPGGSPDFQPHHQPFNYYAQFDPATRAAQRAAHLKDYGDLLADIDGGPPASGDVLQAAGQSQSASRATRRSPTGDAHIADLVAKLRAGPQWSDMVIVITYDEFGGAWDHVAPPRAICWAPAPAYPR